MIRNNKGFSSAQITILTLVVLGIIVGGILFMIRIGVNNTDASLRNKAKAQQTVNMATKDKVWRILKQQAGISQTAFDKFDSIYTKIFDARYKDQNLLTKFVNENNPQLPTNMLQQVMDNVMVLESEFTMCQKQLADIKREHDDLLMKEPGCWFLANKDTLQIVIVTSTSTKNAYTTGIDDLPVLK